MWPTLEKPTFTIDTWILPEELTGRRVIFADNVDKKGNIQIFMFDGVLKFQVKGNSPEIVDFNQQLFTFNWYHITVGYLCGSEKYAILYLNGKLIKKVVLSACGPWTAATAKSRIGNWDVKAAPFAGFILQLRVWDKLLEPIEINTSLMTSNLPVGVEALDLEVASQCRAMDYGPYDVLVSSKSVDYEVPPLVEPVSLLNNGGFHLGSKETCYQYVTNLPGWRANGGTVMIAAGCSAWTSLLPHGGGYILGLQGKGSAIEQAVGVRTSRSILKQSAF